MQTTDIHSLAVAIGATPTVTDHGPAIVRDGHEVYCSFTGEIRLHVKGQPVRTIGTHTDPVQLVADRYIASVWAGAL